MSGGADTTTVPKRPQVAQRDNGHRLERTVFQTSRLLDYFTERELRYQTGRSPWEWPIVIVKELVDNALDACEDAGIAPDIAVTIERDDNDGRITVADNGPGIAPETLTQILDFSVRVSDKEAYVSPTRGAQGNALKTVLAIPYVTSTSEPKMGQVTVVSRGIRHELTVATDLLKQEPRIEHRQAEHMDPVTSISVALDYRGILGGADLDVLYKWLRGYALFNPHAAFRLEMPEGKETWPARCPGWAKWTPSDPTSPWWYTDDDLGRLIAAYIVHAQNGGRDLPVRELVAQFRGLSSTTKQKHITSQLPQRHLSDFMCDGHLDGKAVATLLAALRAEAKPVKPDHLGVLGGEAICNCLASWYELKADCFRYLCLKGNEGDLPYVLEVALARKSGSVLEQFMGLNSAPTYGDPFAELRLRHETSRTVFAGTGLNSLLSEFKVQQGDPLVLVVHLAFPRPRFRDRGKTGLQLGGTR
jgi:hypothetical protein